MNFNTYLKSLAEHKWAEFQKTLTAREKLLVIAGIGLNSTGDLLANPKIKFAKKQVTINKIIFTRTSPEWNKILIDKCHRSPKKLQSLLEKNTLLKKKLKKKK